LSNMSDILIPAIASVTIDFAAPAEVKLSGTLTSPDAPRELGKFFRAVHDGAVAGQVPTLTVDVSALSFVNSSSIRLFIDWAIWAKNATAHRYTLRFVTSKKYTWQRTSFSALRALARDTVEVEVGD
jgi:hypothetical protein